MGREVDDVTCEDDLKAEAGETTRCELTVDGRKQGMTATAVAYEASMRGPHFPGGGLLCEGGGLSSAHHPYILDDM
ncbi:DUF4333 domain-containing protein [Streptomyces anulatus]|uniref:DUF4333 domain-containing protein n=1 Tax=Streptomyces anulatus TaxID=1892 RepID=UPI003628AAA3